MRAIGLVMVAAVVVGAGWAFHADAVMAAGAGALTDSRLDSVITKFQNDNRSFEEYASLGKMTCYMNTLEPANADLFFSLFGNLYNSLTPLARLLKEDAIKKSLNEYYVNNEKRFKECWSRKERENKKASNRYKEIKLCESLFDKNDDLKKQYLKLINDKRNYNDDGDGGFGKKDVDVFRKDYLDNYFIKACRFLDPLCD